MALATSSGVRRKKKREVETTKEEIKPQQVEIPKAEPHRVSRPQPIMRNAEGREVTSLEHQPSETRRRINEERERERLNLEKSKAITEKQRLGQNLVSFGGGEMITQNEAEARRVGMATGVFQKQIPDGQGGFRVVDADPRTGEVSSQAVLDEELAGEELEVGREIPIKPIPKEVLMEGVNKGSIEALIRNSAIGQAVSMKQIFNELQKEGGTDELGNLSKSMYNLGLTPEEVSSDPVVQILLKMDLNELDLKNIEEGNALVSDLQLLMESTKVSSLLTKFGISLTPGKPHPKVKKMLETSRKIDSKVSEIASNTNPQNANKHLIKAESDYQKILQFESLIKLLSAQSVELQSNPDEIEDIRTEIESIKQSIRFSINDIKNKSI